MYCLISSGACAVNCFLPREFRTIEQVKRFSPICFQAFKLLICYRDVSVAQFPQRLTSNFRFMFSDKFVFQPHSLPRVPERSLQSESRAVPPSLQWSSPSLRRPGVKVSRRAASLPPTAFRYQKSGGDCRSCREPLHTSTLLPLGPATVLPTSLSPSSMPRGQRSRSSPAPRDSSPPSEPSSGRAEPSSGKRSFRSR